MTLAAESDVHFNADQAEDNWVVQTGTLKGLDSADRKILSEWLDAVEGIDTVLDLAVRPWNIVGAGAIFGVFETGKDRASWLIVRYGQRWTLARCSDGFVSDVSISLEDVLGLIDTP